MNEWENLELTEYTATFAFQTNFVHFFLYVQHVFSFSRCATSRCSCNINGTSWTSYVYYPCESDINHFKMHCSMHLVSCIYYASQFILSALLCRTIDSFLFSSIDSHSTVIHSPQSPYLYIYTHFRTCRHIHMKQAKNEKRIVKSEAWKMIFKIRPMQ